MSSGAFAQEAGRIAPIAVRTLAVVALLAGCVGTPAADIEPASVGPATIPATLEAEGATIEAIVGGVQLTWEGTVRRSFTGIQDPDLAGTSGMSAVLPLTLPPEVTLLRGKLTWETPNVGPSFRVRNEDGLTLCGGAPSEEGVTECFATLYASREGPSDWDVAVYPGGSAGDSTEIPFTLELFLGTEALPMLGLPAPYGDAAASRFTAPVLLSGEDSRTGEPSIAVTPEGIVYVAAPVGAQRALWRSDDGGVTFREVAVHGQLLDPMSQYPTGGGDSDVAVVGENTVYFADQQAGSGQTVSASHDGGQTWTTNILAGGPPIGADRQWLVADGEDTVWLAFNGPGTPLGRATVTKSIDGGRTWPIRTIVDGDACFRGNLFRDPAGTLYLAGCNADGPGVAVSRDGGLSFEWVNVAARSGETNTSFFYVGHLFVIGTSDAAGNVHVVWVDPSPGGFDVQSPDGVQLNVWLATSKDAGRTWSEPVRVNQAPGTFVLPWVTAGADGAIAVSFMATRYVGHPELALGEWYPVLATSTDGGSTWRESTMTDTPMQYGPVCMRGSACGSARNLLDFFQIQADATGRVHAALMDGTAGGNARLTNILYARSEAPLLGGPSVDKNGGVAGSMLMEIATG